ncbi:hypothetical protein [Methylobacterium nigriterrae]|uniref:hypothetical protein n=1 Tax=Methylobacterium nigriterrae TaxID=3127512 RepID=UPI003013B914
MRRRDMLAGLAAAALAAGPARAAPVVRSLDPRFAAVIDQAARLETVYAGGRWCEGLCHAPDLGGLVFSDVKANRISVLGADGRVRTLCDPSGNANGNTLDAEAGSSPASTAAAASCAGSATGRSRSSPTTSRANR